MEEFAKELGITFEGELENENKYVVQLADSDEYSKVYTILDKSDLVDLDTSSTLVTDKVSELKYVGDVYTVKLAANFVDDIYRVVITKEEL